MINNLDNCKLHFYIIKTDQSSFNINHFNMPAALIGGSFILPITHTTKM